MTVGSNRSVESQAAKRHAILQWIRRHGEASRRGLAKGLGISNSRVCDLVEQMVSESLLVERVEGEDRRGRRGVPVRLNGDYGQLIGFDMEAKRLRLIAVDFAGRTLAEFRQPVRAVKGREALAGRILKFIREGLEKASGQCGNILGLGLAASGVVDVARGTILHYDLLPAARDLPLRDLVATETGLECVMMDNIQALTLAEWVEGAAQHLESFVCVAVRSGVGAGIVINGRLHGGSHGFAGEVGYLPVDSAGGLSTAKPLHEVVSESALGVDAEAKDFALSPTRARRAGEVVGMQVASIATVLDPQAVVLAGPILSPEGPLWDHVVRAFRRMVLPELAERVQLLPARLGPFAAAKGAAHRCFQMRFPLNGAGY